MKLNTGTFIADSSDSSGGILENPVKILKKLHPHPRLSLIIPVLNEEKIIEKTLEKYNPELLNNYNIELIVSDGGSNDKTVEISEKFATHVVKHTKDSKQTISGGRNQGASISTGDILIFMNGDTFPSDVNAFFTTVMLWASCDGKFRDCAGITCWVSVHPEEIIFKDKIFYAIHNRYIKFLNLIGVGMGRGECQIIKKDYFKRLGGYDENLAAGEDFDLFKRLAKIGKIGFLDNIIVYESPRRFRKYGYIRVVFSWIYNALSVIFYGKSLSKEWEPVR